jgi:LysM repeat protein
MRLLTIIIALLVFCNTGNTNTLSPPDSIGYYYQGKRKIIIYEVNKGETLSAISLKYGLPIDLLREHNPTVKKDLIKAGQILKIPFYTQAEKAELFGSQNKPVPDPPNTREFIEHTVVKGETLYGIAKQYNVTVNEILNTNPQIKDMVIKVDQVIKIPSTVKSDIPDGEYIATDEKSEQVIVNKNDQERIKGLKMATISATSVLAVTILDDIKTTKSLQDEIEKDENATDTSISVETISSNTPVYTKHIVLKGETMYALSRKYNVKVTDIMEWNQMKDFNIKEGQELIVGIEYMEDNMPDTTTVTTAETHTLTSSSVIDNVLSLQYKEDLSSNYFVEKDETGIARWIADVEGYPVENGFFALHKTLPIGTIIKVRNLMNNRVIYAKIIGRLPDTENNKKVLLKLPESAKKSLNVLDDQLIMEVKYLKRSN